MHRGRLQPGDYVAAALVAEALLIDVYLVRKKHNTISTCVRRSLAAKSVVCVLTAHLILQLPYDPLTRAGTWLERRWADVIA